MMPEEIAQGGQQEQQTESTPELIGGRYENTDEMLKEIDRLTQETKDVNYYHELGKTVYDLGIDNYEAFLNNKDKVMEYVSGDDSRQASNPSPEDFNDTFDSNPQEAIQKAVEKILDTKLAPLQDGLNLVQNMATQTSQEAQWTHWEQKNPDIPREDFQKFLNDTKYNIDDMTRVYRESAAGKKALQAEAQKKAERARLAESLRGDASSQSGDTGELSNPKSPREAFEQAKRLREAGHTF
jgi:hypothetical protein